MNDEHVKAVIEGLNRVARDMEHWKFREDMDRAAVEGMRRRVLDGVMALVSLIPHEATVTRIAMYLPGLVICSAAIGLILESYFPPAAYELFVKETSAKWGKPFKTVKTVYDLSSLALAVGLSLLLLGRLEGVGIGTVVGALVNGYLIHLFGGLYRRLFTFRDGFPWRGKFEESEERL